MRVAIVGAGIAGMAAAWELRERCEVHLFERDARLGGHANTQDVPDGTGLAPIDTGFIVHNRRTYPHLIRLLDELGVETRETEMSLSVECRACGIQYAGRRPWSLVVGALRRPRLLVLLTGIVRMLRLARRDLAQGLQPEETLRDWAARRRCSDLVVSHFLVPLAAAVWSAPPGRALDMPAGSILAFLDNHGMLSVRALQWRTIVGGSRAYVSALRARLEADGVHVRTGSAVERVRRVDGGVELEVGDELLRFDAIVLAAHADLALDVLDDPTGRESELLGAFTYTENPAVLHRDARMLPTQQSARASWNYRLASCDAHGPAPTVTYFMNRLHGLELDDPWCVTLNAEPGDVAQELEHYRVAYRHPQFDAGTLRAQARLGELDTAAADTRTVFCGAWRGYGFHEDGMRSGVEAARVVLALDRADVARHVEDAAAAETGSTHATGHAHA